MDGWMDGWMDVDGWMDGWMEMDQMVVSPISTDGLHLKRKTSNYGDQ